MEKLQSNHRCELNPPASLYIPLMMNQPASLYIPLMMDPLNVKPY